MPRYPKTSITRQLQLVFGISIILLLLSSAASFYANRKLIEASLAVNHTNEVILSTESLISSVKDAETAQRGYIITNDPSFLTRYQGGRERSLAIWDRLKELTVDNQTQQEYLRELRSLINERYDQMERTSQVIATLAQDQQADVFAKSYGEMLRGKKIMDFLRENVDNMKSEEARLLKLRTGKQEVYTTYTPVLGIIAALISIFISITAYLRIKSDLEARIIKQQEDEARYMETTRRINTMEAVTHRIASGDYTVRSADDAKDELGRISLGLNEMVIALDNTFSELKRKNWLQTCSVNLSDAIRGEQSLKNVAEKILGSVATSLHAAVGTLYVNNSDNSLRLQGSYATSDAPKEIPAGEGLVGQAVQDRTPLISDGLPPHYLKIRSSLGDIPAVFSAVLPLLYGERVIGAMELGMLNPPSEQEMQFLNNNMEAMAISINAAVNYEQLQELLEETQAQAEELQAQHTELEMVNSELEMQTSRKSSNRRTWSWKSATSKLPSERWRSSVRPKS